MYVTQNVSDRIKLLAKKNGVQLKEMLPNIGLGINTVSQLSKGIEISSFSLAKIADYLNCSVDYLLCRTDSPSMIKVSVDDEKVKPNNDQFAAIAEIYEHLSTIGKAKLLIAADELKKQDS